MTHGRWQRWVLGAALAAVAVAGCKPEEATTTPEAGPAERPAERRPKPPKLAPTEGAPEAPEVGQQQPEPIQPSVQDRDPEEEKRKMSLSRQTSAKARKLLAEGKLDDAILQAREALRIHELNAEAMLVLAEAFYEQGKFELAQTVTSSILSIDKKVVPARELSEAHNLRGFALLALGRPQSATKSFRAAAEADATNVSAWSNLGARYVQRGDIKTAISVLEYAVELDPAFYKARINLGAAYRAARRWQDAEAQFFKALELRPDDPLAHFDLGILYLDADPFPGLDTMTRLEKAITHLTKYRELVAKQPPSGPPRRPPAVGRGKTPPEPVSPERADAYILVAKKGIEREKRRKEREKRRKEREAKKKQAAATEGAGEGSAPKEPEPKEPEPKKPEPKEPEPKKPAPKKPEPKKPEPKKPEPKKPEPKKPAPKKPEPKKPAPKKPAPKKPAPQKPHG